MKKNCILTILLVFIAMTGQAESKTGKSAETYNTYIWKADSLFMCGEFAQSSAMFDKAFRIKKSIQGQHLYNAACAAALAGDTDVAFQRLADRQD